MSLKPNGIAIRVDANADIAMGHLKRCISLGKALLKCGLNVTFLCARNDLTKDMVEKTGLGYEFLDATANTANDKEMTIDFLVRYNINTIIFDSYSVNESYISYFRNKGIKTIYLDDIGHYFKCDMVINGRLGAEELSYVADRKLLGIDYCILSPPFWKSVDEIRYNDEVENVLITMGGIDHYRLSERSLRILDNIAGDFMATVIIGPFYENEAAIKRNCKRISRKVELIKGVDNLFPCMSKCDIAISAGGMTLYELATLGKPTVGIGLWENQYGNIDGLSSKDIILGLHYEPKACFDTKLASNITRLITSNDLRLRMAERAKQLFDGQGATRVAQELKKMLSKN